MLVVNTVIPLARYGQINSVVPRTACCSSAIWLWGCIWTPPSHYCCRQCTEKWPQLPDSAVAAIRLGLLVNTAIPHCKMLTNELSYLPRTAVMLLSIEVIPRNVSDTYYAYWCMRSIYLLHIHTLSVTQELIDVERLFWLVVRSTQSIFVYIYKAAGLLIRSLLINSLTWWESDNTKTKTTFVLPPLNSDPLARTVPAF